jgi:hypothetical protein
MMKYLAVDRRSIVLKRANRSETQPDRIVTSSITQILADLLNANVDLQLMSGYAKPCQCNPTWN